MNSLLRSISTALVASGITLVAFISSASAELITSRGFNVSLNTNRFFPLINGDPKMSTYITNPDDGDQQFGFIGGYYNGWVIKHRVTGKCLNGYNKYEGAPINVSPCNFGHLDQAWHALDKGKGYMILRLSSTNLCVTVDSPIGNGSNVVLRNCNYYSANGTQDWRRDAGHAFTALVRRD
ncbi:MAG: RICIN domain-containing protein [candidate division SR1 bacterium]|nr:RICIN domain-containing protein [candidate division SR1 bacterium]